MSVRSVVVAHRETLAAEGIAAALSRYPALAMVGVATSAAETERCARARRRRRDRRAHPRRDGSRGPDAQARHPRRRDRRDPSPTTRRGRRRAGGRPGRAPRIGAGSRRRSAGSIARRSLSGRERQVLRLAAKGMAGKQIARVLGISPKTVEQHKTRAFRRLGVPNQAAAVALLSGGGERAWSPIHYLRALRRRWWVIVRGRPRRRHGRMGDDRGRAGRGPSRPRRPATPRRPCSGTPARRSSGQGSPITDLSALAQPGDDSRTSRRSPRSGCTSTGPRSTSSQQVYATTDPTTGFLIDQRHRARPRDGGADLERVLAVLDRVPGAAAEHEDRSAAATRAGADPEAHRAWRSAGRSSRHCARSSPNSRWTERRRSRSPCSVTCPPSRRPS